MIPPDFIDEVLARTDIVEIIDPRVSLKKKGQNYTGLCPFHNEKTPSFSVSQDKQFYYCFGCQASGSALKFLMEFDRMEFPVAVEYLASRVGMEVPQARSVDSEASRKRKGLYEILEQCADYFREQLKHHPGKEKAVSYLKGRGLTGEIARDFGLGYAPAGWDNLLKKFATTNHDRQLLIDAGMITVGDKDDKVYDRFRERIMYPIRDLRGRTIAFGGRVLSDDAKPKYLNSPETPVFHKGRELYGLHEARKRVRKLSRLLVVEGYMDVVALAQHGIGYSVATLGTATSTEHIERMFRLGPQVVFCFDGDQAGRNAAWKALRATLPAMADGKSARFLFLPDGEDPDTMVRRVGQSAFEEQIDASLGLTEFMFRHLEEGLDTGTPEGKAALAQEASPLIREIPEGVFKQLVISELAEKTGLPEARLLEATGLAAPPPSVPRDPPAPDGAYGGGYPEDDYNDYPPDEMGGYDDYAAQPQKPAISAGVAKLLDHAISVLLHQPEVAIALEDDEVSAVRQSHEWQLLAEMIEWARSNTVISPVVLLSHYQDTGYFSYLRQLAERELLLSPADLAEEFRGTVIKLLKEGDLQLKQEVINGLLSKPLAELTPEEREMLVAHTRSRA